MKSPIIAVIGAGPAGLTAAYFLSKKGLHPTVFEGSQQTGGLGGSVNLWGNQYDIGPHIFLESSQPEAVRFWKEIAAGDLLTMTLSRGMVLNQQMIQFPPQPAGLMSSLGPSVFCRAAADFLRARLFTDNDVTNAGIFFQNKYGSTFRKYVFNPFCEKYMGVPDLQVDFGFATSLTSFVKDAGKKDVSTDRDKLKTLLYPVHGTKMIWSRIEEKVRENGEIVLNKKLNKIITEGNRVVALSFSDGTIINPDFTISTLPVGILLQTIDVCPESLMEERKKLVSRNTLLVYIRLAAKAFGYHYVTIFDHSLEAGRITNFNSWKRSGAASDAETVLCIEYWCDSSDYNWTCANSEIVSKAITELEKAKIIPAGKVTGTEVMRIPNSHPVLNSGYTNSLAAINSYLSRFENLALAGRHATFKWDGQADNIVAGMNLADKIAQFFK